MATYQEQIAKLEAKKNAKADGGNLTQKQIKNWRIILKHMGVPLALTMPDHMVQNFRDALQHRINNETPNVQDQATAVGGSPGAQS